MRFFGECVAFARSPDRVLQFYKDIAWGDKHLRSVWSFAAPWRDVATLHRIGFQVDFSAGACGSLSEQHPVVYYNTELATDLAQLIVSLMRVRLRSLAQYMFAVPGVFVLLLHEEKTVVSQTLRMLAQTWKNWLHVQTLNEVHWKKFVENSPLRFEYVHLVFTELEKASFAHVTPVVDELIRCVFSSIGSTKVAEGPRSSLTCICCSLCVGPGMVALQVRRLCSHLCMCMSCVQVECDCQWCASFALSNLCVLSCRIVSRLPATSTETVQIASPARQQYIASLWWRRFYQIRTSSTRSPARKSQRQSMVERQR